MTIEVVQVKVNIEFEKRRDQFGQGWDFTIDKFFFRKKSNHEVEVSFSYQADLSIEVEGGTRIRNTASEYDPVFIAVRYELEAVLDIISLELGGLGVQIIPETYIFTQKDGYSSRNADVRSVDFISNEQVEDRYTWLKEDGVTGVRNALRLYRLSAGESNEGEAISQLWSAAEVLLASKIPQLLNTESKKLEIDRLIGSSKTLEKDEKDRLKNLVKNLSAHSLPVEMAKQASGFIGKSQEDIDTAISMLKDWRGTRSSQSHGDVTTHRDSDTLIFQASNLIDLLLADSIRPKKYFYIVFKDGSIEIDLEKQLKNNGRQKSGWNISPQRELEYPTPYRPIIASVIDHSSPVLVVDYRGVFYVTKSGDIERFIISNDSSLSEITKELIEKFSE